MWLFLSSTQRSRYFSIIGSWIFCHVRCLLLLMTSYKASKALCFFPTSMNSWDTHSKLKIESIWTQQTPIGLYHTLFYICILTMIPAHWQCELIINNQTDKFNTFKIYLCVCLTKKVYRLSKLMRTVARFCIAIAVTFVFHISLRVQRDNFANFNPNTNPPTEIACTTSNHPSLRSLLAILCV